MKNKRILIVDDEPKNLKILRIRLEKEYELAEAETGEQALKLIEELKPALVLLDIMMPGIDGYEVAKKIKGNPKLCQTKVVLVSGKAMTEEKLEGYKAGADDYITKPFNGSELQAKVKVFVEMFNMAEELKRVNSSLEEQVEVRSSQLIEQERMASVGIHAGEIAHNLKNPITVILGNLRMLQIKKPEVKDLREVQMIESGVNRLLGVIENILHSLRNGQDNSTAPLDLNDIINDELEFLKVINSNFKHNISAHLSLNSTELVHWTISEASQVIGNIIKNGVEAMAETEKKSLTIQTTNRSGFVEVKISDTGSGISRENLEKVFEPMFTTKNSNEPGQSRGTGLGLSFTKRVVEEAGGKVSLSSVVGEGTSITLSLPTVQNKVEAA